MPEKALCTIHPLPEEEGEFSLRLVKRRILSADGGSILDEWEKFQFSEYMAADDVRYLRERCIPQIRMHKQYVGDSEELSFEVEMRPEDVVLLHIYKE